LVSGTVIASTLVADTALTRAIAASAINARTPATNTATAHTTPFSLKAKSLHTAKTAFKFALRIFRQSGNFNIQIIKNMELHFLYTHNVYF